MNFLDVESESQIYFLGGIHRPESSSERGYQAIRLETDTNGKQQSDCHYEQ
jgi:hypothetical protein